MNRLSVLFSVTGFALSAVPVDFRSPLRIEPNGELVASIIVNDRVHSSTRILCNGLDRIGGPSASAEVRVGFKGIDDRSPIYSPDLVKSDTRDEVYNQIGIKSSCILPRKAGAVAVIRRTASEAELVIGSTIDYFLANCKPETLIRLKASATDVVDVELNLVSEEGSSTSFGARHVEISQTAPYKVNYIHQSLSDHINALLVSAGAKRKSPVILSDCTEAMVAALPNMELRFATGSITLSPVDYVKFHEVERLCQLRFYPSSGPAPFQMDPLTFENKNVRVSRDNVWEICDSHASL